MVTILSRGLLAVPILMDDRVQRILMSKLRKVFVLLLITVVLLIMFVLDLSLPAGVIHGIPCVVLVSVSYWRPWRYAPMMLARSGLCSS
jgi:hypothetical protein